MPKSRLSPWILAAGLFAAYSALSVVQHLRFETSAYDLGIFEQAIRSYAWLRMPVSDIKGPGFNVWGDHFHPIIALIAPLYRLFPGPLTLLVVQAGLLAVSAVPVTHLGIARLGFRAGMCIGSAYGLSWGLQQAVSFDFHEIAFAAPLIAASVTALARRSWRGAAGWALPLLFVKEDQALIVAAIGAYVFCGRSRWLGAAVVGTAASIQAIAILVIIPAFNPRGVYPYARSIEATDDNPLVQLLTPATKEAMLLALLAPVLFLAVRSPLLLLALPSVGARLWSSNPAYWGTAHHYSAVLMPIVFIAFIDALFRLRTSRFVVASRILHMTPAASLVLALCWTGFTQQPLARFADRDFWRLPSDTGTAGWLLSSIPDGARVAASNRLAPQLTSRCRVFLYPSQPTAGLRPEWLAITDTPRVSPIPAWYEEAATARLLQQGYVRLARGGGITLYHLNGWPEPVPAITGGSSSAHSDYQIPTGPSDGVSHGRAIPNT